jgi:choline dehydrogenase-like flavoprotein
MKNHTRIPPSGHAGAVMLPEADTLQTEVAVIGAGPGGVVTAALLAEAGYDVLMVEEGSYLRLDSAPHFSCNEIAQKYRNGGITVGMGVGKLAYVEGRCVGGGSEVNRGLYHRTPPDILDTWRREFNIAALTDTEMQSHHEACERIARVSPLPGPPPLLSAKLQEGAARLGWRAVAVPRLVSYVDDPQTGRPVGRKQSMSETFVPRFLNAGGRLLPDTRVVRLARHAERWEVSALHSIYGRPPRVLSLVADTVFVACGAIQTPGLLRRSGMTRNVGDTLCFHPMIKLVAAFPEEINTPGQFDPVHQVKEFDPRFSMGCSISTPPMLALSLVEQPDCQSEVDRNWRHMGIYYAQTTGGRGVVRTVPGFRDVLVRWQYRAVDMRDLGEGLRKLGECLFAAGAVALYPAISGVPVLRSVADLDRLPMELSARRASLSTLHLFSTCPMGEDVSRCVTDSFGKVRGTDGLYLSDASILPGPTVVNPQGSVMAMAHRNALRFLEQHRARSARRPIAS